MGIVDEDVERVRDSSDIVAVISEHLGLKRVGRSYTGLCPFHAEKSPSFSVSPERGRYYCFGCQAKGDVITFLREVEGLDFVGAVEKLAGRLGMALRYTTQNEGAGRARRTELIEVIGKAVDWYHERLLTGPDAAAARSYLRSRGFDGDTVRAYRLGWAPDDWDALAKALKLSDRDLTDSGLGLVNRRQRQQDWFRARVLFPIMDPQGDPLGFGGRILPGSAEKAKYMNTPQTKVYDKSKVLYGLNWAKTDIVSADEAIICEGYTDVIGFARAGLNRAVATCGTALTEDHIRLLKRFAKRVVLAFDADNAGQNAADRVYQWEQAHEVDVAVAALPDGVDPGELAISDPAALAAAVANALPFLAFRINRVLAKGDLRTAEGRARTAEAALDAVREHPSDLVRDQYVMEIAGKCRIDAAKLRERLQNRRPIVVDTPARRAPTEGDGPELEVLRLAVHKPEEVGQYLDAVLFTSDLHAAAFEALAPGGTLHDAIERSDPAVAELLSRLAVEESDAEPMDVVMLLVHQAGRRMIEQLRQRGDDVSLRKVVELGPLVDRTVDPTTPDLAAIDQLVASLAHLAQDDT